MAITYVPLQVNRFQKSILLIVQYKYSESCSRDFYSPESDPPHKIMLYWFLFRPTQSNMYIPLKVNVSQKVFYLSFKTNI